MTSHEKANGYYSKMIVKIYTVLFFKKESKMTFQNAVTCWVDFA